MRFNKSPGDPVLTVADGEGYAIPLGDDTPDDVTLPPELGGSIVKVIKSYWRLCPVHGSHNVKCLQLENNLHVAECDQFYWFTVGASSPDT